MKTEEEQMLLDSVIEEIIEANQIEPLIEKLTESIEENKKEEKLPVPPDIVGEPNDLRFVCPVCGSSFIYGWDKKEHCVIYPDHCDICECLIVWDKKITDLIHEDIIIPHNTYKKTGYFTKKKGIKKK